MSTILLAQLDPENTVKAVLVMDASILQDGASSNEEENAQAYCRALYSTGDRFLLTSDNGELRGNMASPGYQYHPGPDLFMPPKPYPSFVINEEEFKWVPPVPMPNTETFWVWDEASLSWVAPPAP